MSITVICSPFRYGPQGTLTFFSNRPAVASGANIIVVVVMVFLLGVTGRVLHPPAPIRDTENLRIQAAFAAMTALLVMTGFQLARLRRQRG